MGGGHLIALYRSLMRHKLYSALNILGLAAGTAVFLILWLAVRYEHGFDRWIPGAEAIHRIDSTYTFPALAAAVEARLLSEAAPLALARARSRR